MIEKIRKLGIRKQFIGATVLLMLLIGVFNFVYVPMKEKNQMSKYLSDKAMGLAQMAARGAATGMLFGDAASTKGTLETVEGIDAVSFAVAFTPDGKQFAAFQGDKSVPHLQAIMKGLTTREIILINDDGLLLAIAPVLSGKDKIGIVAVGIDQAGLNSDVATSRLVAFIISVIIIGIGAFFALGVTRFVTKPIKALADAADTLAMGNINVHVEPATDDEIGKLATSFNAMIENIRVQADAAQKVAEGDLNIKIVERSPEDQLAKSMQKVVGTLQSLIAETRSLTTAALKGDLSNRGNEKRFEGQYKEIVASFNATLDSIITPVHEGIAVLSKMAEGDMTVRITTHLQGDHQILKNSINTVAESLDHALQEVTDAVVATASASSEISASTEEMAAGAQVQTQQASEVAVSVEEMTKTILDTTKNASKAADIAKKAGYNAREGGRVVIETMEGMVRIAAVVKQSATTVQALGKSSDQIGEIVQVIDDIADQTNLLALNAAIEAARAGEQGRGFAVVADEVRKLAERTTKATKEIATMIKKIQKDTTGAVESMNKGTAEVENGRTLAEQSSASLKEIIKGSENVVDVITQVAAASEEQSSASELISKNIESISSVTQESASGTQQIARTAEDLNHLTQNLQDLLGRFQLSSRDTHSDKHVSHGKSLVQSRTKRLN